ncbi:hypothetical protein PR048_002986 [Dryococelus australis]|uniref:Integrase catalytic domain-containing protein n=1 Tax=Dryococelus australis TaxID=614101 RepID=A0ABQ9IMB2_9NEOP|nr:hypothetical protein PR048_002986 [Dryococelus australis]
MESSVKVALKEKPIDSSLDDGTEQRKRMKLYILMCVAHSLPRKTVLSIFVVFKDDFSKFRTIYLIKNKDEVFGKLKEFLTETGALGHKVMCVRCDNGGEFNNESLQSFLKIKGIEIRYKMLYTLQQNGCAERENHTIVELQEPLCTLEKNLFPWSFGQK